MKAPLSDLPAATAIVVYDGACALCARSIHFIAAHDPAVQFRFTASRTDIGRDLLAHHGLDLPQGPGTMVFIEDGLAYVRSTAALRIARRLSWPWRALSAGLVVPLWLRDGVYRIVARYRYRWFGTRDACAVPSAQVRARLL